MESLSGQKVVITGITGGIAYATAQRLLDLDADLIVSARTQDKLDTALSNLKGDIKGHTMDLSDASSIESFFAKTGPFDHRYGVSRRIENRRNHAGQDQFQRPCQRKGR